MSGGSRRMQVVAAPPASGEVHPTDSGVALPLDFGLASNPACSTGREGHSDTFGGGNNNLSLRKSLENTASPDFHRHLPPSSAMSQRDR